MWSSAEVVCASFYFVFQGPPGGGPFLLLASFKSRFPQTNQCQGRVVKRAAVWKMDNALLNQE
jgi:hypothetical protein